MVTAKNLLDAGYNRYPTGVAASASGLFQKDIRDKAGEIRYFLNFDEFDFRHVPVSRRRRDMPLDFIFEPVVEFTTKSGFTLRVTVIASGKTVEEIEAEVERVFTALDCVGYGG